MVLQRRALRATACLGFAVAVVTVAWAAHGVTADAPMRWILLPPLAAAAFVLLFAAVAVDYFGLRRRSRGWRGVPIDPRERDAAAVKSRALQHRFDQHRRAGHPNTPAVARALLLALGESDRLTDAAAVVDFLSADAVFTRVGTDLVADSLRAVALAELGRHADAQALVAQLGARRRYPLVVDYARARVAGLGPDKDKALSQLDKLLTSRRSRPLRRELMELRARILSNMGRFDQATASLRDLAAENAPAVAQLVERAREAGDAALVRVGVQALSGASPYR